MEIEAKSFEILVKELKQKVLSSPLDEDRCLSSWIRFREDSLIALCEGLGKWY